MKSNKLIFSCFLILIFLIPTNIFSQGYNGTILVYYRSSFDDPFEWEHWDHLDPDDIKSAVTAKVVQHFQTQFGISVTDNENDSWHLKVDIGGLCPDQEDPYLGECFGIGSYIDQNPDAARVYSEEFYGLAKFQGETKGTVARISNAIAGVAIHELGHKFNCRHAHCFDHYDSSDPDWLDGSYYPLEPVVLLSNEVVDTDIHHPHARFMVTVQGYEWISLDERAETPQVFSDHSKNMINLAKNGYITPAQNMAWGLPNRTFTQGGVIQINAGKDFKFGGGSYTHNMNNYHIYPYGSSGSMATFTNVPGPEYLTVENVNSPPRILLNWGGVVFAYNFNIYRKVGSGNFSFLTNTSYSTYYDSDIDQQSTSYTYYITSCRSGEWNSSDQESVTSPGPLTGNISHDNTPAYYEWVHFTANVTSNFGSGNYSFEWYIAPDEGGNPGDWDYINNTQEIYMKCTIWPFHLKCEVDDNTYTLFSGTLQKSYGAAKVGLENKSPDNYFLFNNYPNPFNPETTIKFAVPESVPVTLNIYDITGKLVRNLVNDTKRRGFHNVKWDGKDNSGNKVSSGVYIYKLLAGTFVESKKMTLLK